MNTNFAPARKNSSLKNLRMRTIATPARGKQICAPARKNSGFYKNCASISKFLESIFKYNLNNAIVIYSLLSPNTRIIIITVKVNVRGDLILGDRFLY